MFIGAADVLPEASVAPHHSIEEIVMPAPFDTTRTTPPKPAAVRRPFSFMGTRAAPVEQPTPAAPPPTGEVRPKYRVLVIEDDLAVSRLIEVNLLKAGLESHAATDGILGLQEFQDKEPHLVLLDLMLPGMNGFEVCQSIRKKSRVPVIMMTARVETTHQMRGFRLGADDYVLKPFDPQILVARVIAHLRRTYRYDQGEFQLRKEVPTSEPAGDEVAIPPTAQRQKEILSTLPDDWAACGACSYMGPLKQFPRRYNGHNQNVLTCPHCGVEKSVQFSVG